MSHRRSIPAAFSRTLASLLALSLAVASCSHRVTAVDPGFTTPEGTFSPDARLIVWLDLPNPLAVYQDKVPPGPDAGDVLLFVRDYRRSVPGATHGLILDHTAAGEYQAFRTEDNGGVRRFTDFPAPRTKQWLETQWEAYHFIDPAPAAPGRYVARGLINRVANAQSPLSNLGILGFGSIQPLSLSAVWWPTRAATHPEGRGKLKLHWVTIPQADRYLIQVYQLRGDIRTVDDIILSGVPAPMYDGVSREFFVGYAGPDVDFMFVGDSTRTDIDIVTLKPLSSLQVPLVRVSALDAGGRLIATTPGAIAFLPSIAGENTYGLFSLNSVVALDTVTPSAPSLVASDIPSLGRGAWTVAPKDLPRSAVSRIRQGWGRAR
jgi:hypothetical protein